MNKKNLSELPPGGSIAGPAGIWGNLATGDGQETAETAERDGNATRAPMPDRSRPGKLRGWINARFHTNEAIAAVQGRFEDGVPHIIGLREFAKKSQLAYEMSALDDPFADYLLVQIEAREEEIREYMRQSSEKHHALMKRALTNEVRNIRGDARVAYEFSKTGSERPRNMRFFFGNYGSRALYNVVQYDELVMLLKTLEHRGVIGPDECRAEIRTARHRIRGFLALGSTYAYGGCTRSDLRERNRTAAVAVEKLLSRGFLDSRMFNGMEDLCRMFANYGERAKYARHEALIDEEPKPGETGSEDAGMQ